MGFKQKSKSGGWHQVGKQTKPSIPKMSAYELSQLVAAAKKLVSTGAHLPKEVPKKPEPLVTAPPVSEHALQASNKTAQPPQKPAKVRKIRTDYSKRNFAAGTALEVIGGSVSEGAIHFSDGHNKFSAKIEVLNGIPTVIVASKNRSRRLKVVEVKGRTPRLVSFVQKRVEEVPFTPKLSQLIESLPAVPKRGDWRYRIDPNNPGVVEFFKITATTSLVNYETQVSKKVLRRVEHISPTGTYPHVTGPGEKRFFIKDGALLSY